MPKIPSKLFYLFSTVLLFFCPVPEVGGQTITSGAIQGFIYESGTRTPLIGAMVTVTNQESGLVRSTLTDSNGAYFIRMLPVGTYMVTGTMTGYESIPTSWSKIPVRIMDPSIVTPPPIELRKIVVPVTGIAQTTTPSQPGAQPQATGQTQTNTTATTTTTTTTAKNTTGTQTTMVSTVPGQTTTAIDIPESEQLVNTTNASRTSHFDLRLILALPLANIRTFDDLAFLAAGVAPPPLAIGSVIGPGIGAGVGTSGQYAVNGIRSRANNYTIDGSDNNDEDIGVRRQGFTSLIPQTIESMQAVQITTLLPEPQVGRNMGAQINGVSRSGGSKFHGTLFGFLSDSHLNARDAFDLTGGPATFPIAATNGTPVMIGRLTTGGASVDARQLAPANPVNGESPFTRTQLGLAIGGPIVKDRTHFFFSFENQAINASKESHFAVPTIAQRGLFGTGDTGLIDTDGNAVFPSSLTGNAFTSLYPFPNNPRGPFGNATYTAVLPASADGRIFSGKLDQKLDAFGRAHTLTGRYNFTDDKTILPSTGDALFSTQRALVRTQNLSLFLDTAVSTRAANQLRASYGRTSLRFEEIRDPFLLTGGKSLTSGQNRSYLLNAPYIYNRSSSGNASFQILDGIDTESVTGPLGQVVVTGYSPIGVDVHNFPQQRTNNTYQIADTLIYDFPKNRITTGFDIRLTQLNSFLDRNFRPLAVFNGAEDVAPTGPTQINPGGFYFGRDYLSVGAPTGFFQTFANGTPDSTIGLSYKQYNFFLADQIRIKPNFTLTLGMRYELNTVPAEKYRRIESTFNSPEVRQFIDQEKSVTKAVFGQSLSGFENFLSSRTKIYQTDANNLAPHIAFAWDPFGTGKTSIRAGYGIYYDQILGAVISQSRNVFPRFLTVNFGGFNPNCVSSPLTCSSSLSHQLVAQNPYFFFASPGTLNRYSGLLGDPVTAMLVSSFLTNVTTGPGFILPNAKLETPYAQHWGLTIEREIARDYHLSVAYVGTKGTNLLRFATPNLGPNSIAYVSDITVEAPITGRPDLLFPAFFGLNLPPSGLSTSTLLRPYPLSGSFASIESDANSSYHSLQVQFNKRFARGLLFTTAYTWSHAIDEVSDLFDLAGAPALPQSSFNRSAERGAANFDVRHRFVYSLVWNLPGYNRKDLLGGWQLASIGQLQTAQPYSVLFCCDINQDGNASDRITGLSPFDAGTAPRNTFRAQPIAVFNLAVNKYFNFGESNRLEVRSEFFNLFNRAHYGIPVNRLFYGDYTINPLTDKNYYDTRIPARTIQFGLKYVF